MAKPKNKATRTYVCQGRLSRTTNALETLHQRRVTASMLFDAALDRLTDKHREQTLTGNDAQLLTTTVAREIGLSHDPLNTRCRIAIVGKAVTAHNAHVKNGAGLPRKYAGKPMRTIDTYAHNSRFQRPLVTFNQAQMPTLRFPGLPPIRLLSCRPLPQDQPTYASVSVDGKRVQVHLTYRVNQEPLPAHGQWDPRNVLGLDLGVTELMASSAGISYQGISQAALQQQVRQAQRYKQAMVRKALRAGLAGFRARLDENNRQLITEKGTPRRYLHWVRGHPTREYRRAAQRLSRLLRQRTQQRRAYRHQVAANIVRHCVERGLSLIALERLNIPNMTRSASGTTANPGRRVAQKRSLNRRILEQGWAELTGFIRYKTRQAGIRTVLVHPGGTSQTCSQCGLKDPRSRRRKRFHCTGCGHQADADQNAALNIGDRGTYIYLRPENVTLEDIRRQRVTRAGRCTPGQQEPATGTDDAPTRRGAPRAEPAPIPAPHSNSSQLTMW